MTGRAGWKYTLPSTNYSPMSTERILSLCDEFFLLARDRVPIPRRRSKPRPNVLRAAVELKFLRFG